VGKGTAVTATPTDSLTTLIRRATSILSFLFFFGLIVCDYGLGIVAKDVPMFIYCLLASLAVVAHDKFVDMIQQLKGGAIK
jgi:hypothetical protein